MEHEMTTKGIYQYIGIFPSPWHTILLPRTLVPQTFMWLAPQFLSHLLKVAWPIQPIS